MTKPGKLILVADDESHITYLLARKLQQAGFEVVTACHGQQALEMALTRPPALVVTDFQMPLLSGLELAVKLKAAPATAETPVIILTARGHRIPPAELVATNVVQLLPKPFSIKELLAQVVEVLGSAVQESEAAGRSSEGIPSEVSPA